MNKEIREIIDVAKKYSDASRKAREHGIIGVYELNTFQIHAEDEFRNLVASATQRPVEKKRDCNTYPWEYAVEVDGVRFIYLSEEPLQF